MGAACRSSDAGRGNGSAIRWSLWGRCLGGCGGAGRLHNIGKMSAAFRRISRATGHSGSAQVRLRSHGIEGPWVVFVTVFGLKDFQAGRFQPLRVTASLARRCYAPAVDRG